MFYVAASTLMEKTLAITTADVITTYAPKHKLAVIVPYRDRLEELLEFVPYMSQYLREQNIHYHIYVVNQVDSHRYENIFFPPFDSHDPHFLLPSVLKPCCSIPILFTPSPSTNIYCQKEIYIIIVA